MNNKSSAPWRIFVSSTREDLIPYREAVEGVLTGMEHIPLGMEFFVSSPESPLDVCLATVRRSQLYILILGMRYGSVEEGSQKSFTELEYDEAIKSNIPVLAFVIDENECLIKAKYVDTGDKAEKLKQFKEKVKSSLTVSTFTSVEDLRDKVARSVRQAIDRISADEQVKKAAQSKEPALVDYVEGAELYRQYILMPRRYKGREAVLRIRMDGVFAPCSRYPEMASAYGFDPADSLYGSEANIIGIDLKDVDRYSRSIGFIAEGSAADWLLDNKISKGTVFEGRFRLAYEEYVRNTYSRDEKIRTPQLVLLEGKIVLGTGE